MIAPQAVNASDAGLPQKWTDEYVTLTPKMFCGLIAQFDWTQ